MVALDDSMTWEEITEKILRETGQLENRQFREWLLTKKYIGYTIGQSEEWLYLYNVYKKVNHRDSDHFECVCGVEGWGKSTVAIKKAIIIDPTFCRKQIFNDRISLFEWLLENNGKTKGKAIVLDEGNLFLFNREFQTSGSIDTVKMITLMRQANLYVLICISNYTTIDSYVRTHRLDALTLITVEKKEGLHYGKMAIDKINVLLKKGVPLRQINIPEGLYHTFNWRKDLPIVNDINVADYKSIKNDTWTSFLQDSVSKLKESEKPTESKYYTANNAAIIMGIENHTVIKRIMSGLIPGKKIGNRWFIPKDCVNNLTSINKTGHAGASFILETTPQGGSDASPPLGGSNNTIVNADPLTRIETKEEGL